MPQKRDNEKLTETIKAVDDRIVLRIQFVDDKDQITYDSGFVDTGVSKEVYLAGIDAQIAQQQAMKLRIEEAESA